MSDDLTTVLAIWGAFLSTVAVGWNIFHEVRHRGRLRVHCFFEEATESRVGPHLRLCYRMTNVGRLPVLPTRFGGRDVDRTKPELRFRWHDEVPMLQPGDYLVDYVDDWKEAVANLKTMEVHDSLGGVYRAPRRDLKTVRAKAAERLHLEQLTREARTAEMGRKLVRLAERGAK